MKRKAFFTHDDIAAYILILPFCIFFFFFVILPIIYTVWQSFTDFTGISTNSRFVGMENYRALVNDKAFIKALQNTVIFAVVSVLALIPMGFLSAVALNAPLKRIVAARAVLVFPYITSMVAVSMIWLYMFEPNNGIMNHMLSALGISTQKWLYDPKLALWCLIFVNIWKNTGYVMLIFLAGLQGIPAEHYEAAKVDGASGPRIMLAVTIPQLKPVTLFVFITMTIESFKTFDIVRIMTDGNPLRATTTIVHQIYLRAFSEFKYGYASSMSVALLMIILVIIMINLKLTGFWKNSYEK